MVRDQLYEMLASSRDPVLAQRALELALTDEPGNTLSSSMIDRVADEHPDLAFDFAVAHKDAVDAMIDPNERIRFYPSLVANSHDPAMPAKMQEFSAKFIDVGSRMDADAAVENVNYRIKLRAERLPAVDAWLAAVQPGQAD
jgi:aminopeptidase N